MRLRMLFGTIVLSMLLSVNIANAGSSLSASPDVKSSEPELLFSDSFSITSSSTQNLNIDIGTPRQDGALAPLAYSKRPDSCGWQALTDGNLIYWQQQALYLYTGSCYNSDWPNVEPQWVSPNYDFIKYGVTSIRYKVDPEDEIDNCSTVLFGSSIQGDGGYFKAYSEGNGTVFNLSRTTWSLEYDQGVIRGDHDDHEGYFDVRIDIDNNDANTTLNIWIDDVKVLDNWTRFDRFGNGYGYTSNYISLGAKCAPDIQAGTYYDDFSVTNNCVTVVKQNTPSAKTKSKQTAANIALALRHAKARHYNVAFKILESDINADTLLCKAKILLLYYKDYDGAMAILRQVISDYSDGPLPQEAMIDLGTITLWNMWETEKARKIFALLLENAQALGLDESELVYHMAYCTYVEKDYDGAKEEFQSVCDTYPESIRYISALFMVGDCAQRTGDNKTARNAFEQVNSDSEDATLKENAQKRLEVAGG